MKALIFYLLPRYLRFDKTQPFISITALLAFFGVRHWRYGAVCGNGDYEWYVKGI